MLDLLEPRKGYGTHVPEQMVVSASSEHGFGLETHANPRALVAEDWGLYLVRPDGSELRRI